LLLLRRRFFTAGTATAAATTSAIAAGTALTLRLRLLRLLLRLRLFLLLLLLRLTLRALSAFSARGTLIASSAFARRTLSGRTALFIAAFLPRPLLEFLHLPLHELPRL
jgi:hypothetical protein